MSFPGIEISEIAKRESWRKEIYRPIYHIHKWWAQRLGSVFRACVIHAFEDEEDEWREFYRNHDYNGVVLDPFMGSGTTLGEALKLGCRVIGNDINPVSSFLVKEALRAVDIDDIERAYSEVEAKVASKIQSYHMTKDPVTGELIPVLYYFWVMTVKTPDGEVVPLFDNYFISHNAYPARKPEAQILCPECGSVFEGRYKEPSSLCPSCGNSFDANRGPASKQSVVDSLGREYRIKDIIDPSSPPEERPYALLCVRDTGEKLYLPFGEYDKTLYLKAEMEVASVKDYLPHDEILPGYNSDQARGYGFKKWLDLFNARESLCLGLLLKAIMEVEDEGPKNQLLCLFNSTLEFNNRFCSYKGEGTGAVRPIFSNHILKPERKPIENSVWGFKQSSGCFASLFKSRLLKGKIYLQEPFELRINEGGKTEKVVCSSSMNPVLVDSYSELADTPNAALVLNCDSAQLPLPDSCVDAVITDPPYFDFVNYSELSDFFHAWLRIALSTDGFTSHESSRRNGEVQSSDSNQFARRLGQVFAECSRAMKDNATLTFSFHHSRDDGWDSIIDAIASGGLYVTEVYPVYAELSAATPKSSAKAPITIDMMIVCRKREYHCSAEDIASQRDQAIRILAENGFSLSENDAFVIDRGFSLLANQQG